MKKKNSKKNNMIKIWKVIIWLTFVSFMIRYYDYNSFEPVVRTRYKPSFSQQPSL